MRNLLSALKTSDLFTINGKTATFYQENPEDDYCVILHWEPTTSDEHFLPLTQSEVENNWQDQDGSFNLRDMRLMFYRRIQND